MSKTNVFNKSTNRTPKTKLKNSNFAANQNALKNQLKQIDMAKKNYENFYSHEKRKIINRFANSLLNLSLTDAKADLVLPKILYQNDELSQSEPNFLDTVDDMFSTRSSSSSPTNYIERYENSFLFEPLMTINSENIFNHLGKINEELETTKLDSSIKSSNETPKIELTKLKKTVKWVDKISGYENYEKESFKPNNLYENSKRNILKPKTDTFILPKIPMSKRSNSEYDESGRSSSTLNINEPKIKDKQSFLSLLDKKNSGFYQYNDSKGRPLCDGYDNFGNLSKTNSTNKQNGNEGIITKGFKDPFESKKKNIH